MRACAWVLAWTCGAGAAHAEEAEPLVLYGRVHALVESVASGNNGTRERLWRVTNQASMFGVRGAERLTPSLSAWFQLETGFAIDGSATAFANRNSAVGLKGAWGTLLAGRWDSPFEQAQAGIVDPFIDQGLPDITAAAIQQGNFARRPANALQFWSPSWHGLQVKVGYATHESRVGSTDPDDYGASIIYSDLRSYLALSYERHRDQAGTVFVAGSDEEGFGIAAAHRWGGLKLEGQVGVYSRTGTLDQHSYAVGFEWALPAAPSINLLGIYQRAWHGGARALDEQPDCRVWGIGAKGFLSKRTFLIAQLARVDNRRGSSCSFGSNPIAVADGGALRGLGIGIRTVF